MTRRERLIASLVVAAGTFAGLAGLASCVGQAFEQLARALDEHEAHHLTEVLSETQVDNRDEMPVGFAVPR